MEGSGILLMVRKNHGRLSFLTEERRPKALDFELYCPRRKVVLLGLGAPVLQGPSQHVV